MQITFTVVCLLPFLVRASTALFYNGDSSWRRETVDSRIIDALTLALRGRLQDAHLTKSRVGLGDDFGQTSVYKRGGAQKDYLQNIFDALDLVSQKMKRPKNYIDIVIELLNKRLDNTLDPPGAG